MRDDLSAHRIVDSIGNSANDICASVRGIGAEAIKFLVSNEHGQGVDDDDDLL